MEDASNVEIKILKYKFIFLLINLLLSHGVVWILKIIFHLWVAMC
jgi:hypothetical protein